jgi:hypothetical protein
MQVGAVSKKEGSFSSGHTVVAGRGYAAAGTRPATRQMADRFFTSKRRIGLAGLERSRIVSMEKFDLEAECDFRGLPPEEVEAACKYEYLRESQTLRATISDPKKSVPGLLPGLTLFELLFRWMPALRTAGFPKPWKQLSKASKTQLVSLLAKSRKGMIRGDKALYPPVVIEEASVEFDRSGETDDEYYHWRLEPFEPNLLRKWEQAPRNYFFGFIRIDEAYNQTEAVEAFKKEFKKQRLRERKQGFRERWPKAKSSKSRQRLMQLAVMRIWKHKRKQWDRLKLVANLCSYKGCVEEAAEYKARCQPGYGDEPMSDAAKVEMSSARKEARTFFQEHFSEFEEPLSWVSRGKKLTAKRKAV